MLKVPQGKMGNQPWEDPERSGTVATGNSLDGREALHFQSSSLFLCWDPSGSRVESMFPISEIYF